MSEFKYKCVRCEANFINKIDLQRHLDKKKKCDSIDENFSLTDEQVAFISLSNQINKKKRGKQYNKKNNDNKEGGYQCEYCKELFNFRSNLSRHKYSCLLNPRVNTEYQMKKQVKDDKTIIIINEKNENHRKKLRSFNEFFKDDIFDMDRILLGVLGEGTNLDILKKLLEFPENMNFIPLDKKYLSYIKFHDREFLTTHESMLKNLFYKLLNYKEQKIKTYKKKLKLNSFVYDMILNNMEKERENIKNDIFCSQFEKTKYIEFIIESVKKIDMDDLKEVYDLELRDDIETHQDFYQYLLDKKLKVLNFFDGGYEEKESEDEESEDEFNDKNIFEKNKITTKYEHGKLNMYGLFDHDK